MKIIGHQEQIKKLKHILNENKLGHAYIFEGIEGIGKCTIAKEFAKALLCLNGGDKPCNECIACQNFEAGKNFYFIKPEGNLIKVDEIRKLKEELMLKPITSSRKVAIIDNAELMNEQAQNALLKVLEEPPEYATIILVTANKEKLLYTIKSRCTTFRFQPLKNEAIEEFFGNQIEDEMLEYSRGSIGAIVKARENNDTEVISRWVQAFKKESLIEMMKDMNSIKEEKYVKENVEDVLEYLLYLYYKEMRETKKDTTEAIEIVEETRNNILKNANLDIALDRMMINLWKWRKVCKRL